MRISQILNRVRGCEVKAQSNIDHRADDKGPANPIPALKLLARKLQGSMGIGLPEIDARAEPVIIVVAGFEGFGSGKQALP